MTMKTEGEIYVLKNRIANLGELSRDEELQGLLRIDISERYDTVYHTILRELDVLEIALQEEELRKMAGPAGDAVVGAYRAWLKANKI